MKPKLKSRNNATVAPRAGFLIPESGALPTASDAYAGHLRRSDGVLYASDGNAWHPLGPVVTVGPWYINDLSGTSSDIEPHFLYFNTATAVSQGGNGFDYFYMPAPGAVVGAVLNSDATRATGTATLRLDKGGTPQDFAAGSCVLNATNTNRISVWVPQSGVAGTTMDAFKPRITTASWTPVTANLTMWLFVRFDA